jgi:hypothetical protein
VAGPTCQWHTTAHGRVSQPACAHVHAVSPRWLGHRLPPHAAAVGQPLPPAVHVRPRSPSPLSSPCRSRRFEHIHSHTLIYLCSLSRYTAPTAKPLVSLHLSGAIDSVPRYLRYVSHGSHPKSLLPTQRQLAPVSAAHLPQTPPLRQEAPPELRPHS